MSSFLLPCGVTISAILLLLWKNMFILQLLWNVTSPVPIIFIQVSMKILFRMHQLIIFLALWIKYLPALSVGNNTVSPSISVGLLISAILLYFAVVDCDFPVPISFIKSV